MSVTVDQLKNEKIGLESQLHEIKDRRIEATLTGTEFSEYSDIESISYRIGVLDEAIVVAEKREEADRKRFAREAEVQRRKEQRAGIMAIASDGVTHGVKDAAALSDFVKHMSNLSWVFDQQRTEQRNVPTAREFDISTAENVLSDLIQARLRTITHPDDRDRRHYGRIVVGADADKDWQRELDAHFSSWAQGLISILDRQTREDDNADE